MIRVLVAIIVTGTVAIATGDPVLLDQDALNTLTAIDMVPTKQQINRAFDNDEQKARDSLATIATDPDPQNVAVRLRAIHALAKYCGTPTACTASDVAHQSIASVITANKTATTGSPVLVLRAAIETLGTMKVAADVSTLVPLLNHPSRDIRAATARALRDLCNAQAITPLRARYSAETTDQVKLAISEALRILGTCSANQ